jgi:hypothetical protein
MVSARSALAILALVASPTIATAGTLYVDAGLATGNDDGTSWAHAFQGTHGLQAALAAAAPGDLVFAAQGTYLPSAVGARTAAFVLASGVEVYGGFQGGEASPAERPPFGTAPSVLSGDLAGDDGGALLGDNSLHVVRGAGAAASAVLDGFTVTGGNADGAGIDDKGAGLLCNGSQAPTIRNCRFTSNRAAHGGAGYVSGAGAAPTFTDCTFEDNLGTSTGGALTLSLAGAVRLERCAFRDNVASRGGGLDVSSTDGAVVSTCLFAGNHATSASGGGAVWIGGFGTTEIQSSTLVANTSDVHPVGGLVAGGGAVVIAANCILWDNAGPGGAQASLNQISGVAATYSIVEGGLAGAGNLAADPQFAGPGDHAPLATSPAVDAGSNASVPAGTTLDLAGGPRCVTTLAAPDTGDGIAPLVDIGAYEQGLGPNAFCDGSDGSLAACPCANPGAPDTGCDLSQSTGGVRLDVLSQETSPNAVTLTGTGFSTMGSPVALVIRSKSLDPLAPAVFGDGVRCVSLNGLVRLAATLASNGTSTHAFGHGSGPNAGPGVFYYQLWFRSLPTSFCDPALAYGTSSGRALSW